MANDNDRNKKGFSGLVNLASDASSINDAITMSGSKEEVKPEMAPPPQQTAPSEPMRKATSSQQLTEPKDSGANNGNFVGGCLLGIVFVICVIWELSGGKSNTSFTPPSSSNPEPQYTMPSFGTNNTLSVPEIRWCVREEMRIDAMRDVVTSDTAIDEFNRIVDDYNRRCISFRYQDGHLSRARRDMEPHRSKIIFEAIREGRKLDALEKA